MRDVEAMEGFGVLRAAELAGVAALELRVISNSVLEADRSRWQISDAITILRDNVSSLPPALIGALAS